MAVLIEGITLVVPVAKLEERQPGATKELLRMVGKTRFCSDDSIAAVAFRPRGDDALMVHVARFLRRAGLVVSGLGFWRDLALIYQKTASPTLPCDWLHLGRTADGVLFATLDPDDLVPFEIMVPTNWSLGSSLSKMITHVPLDQHDQEFEYIGSDDSADIYRNRETGKEVRAALTRSTEHPRQSEMPGPSTAGEPAAGAHAPRYRQMPDNTPKPKEEEPMFDKEGNEIVMARMGFADWHEIDEGSEEGEYMQENVFAVKVGPNRYRLAENPVLTKMAAFHDVVEGEIVDGNVLYVQRVVEKSGMKTIRTGVSPDFHLTDVGKAFFDKVVEAGGMWDAAFWGMLVLTIPDERAEEFEELYAVACREAQLVEGDATELLGDL